MGKNKYSEILIPHRNFLISLKITFLIFLIFSLFRILFFLYHYDIYKNIEYTEIIKSFIVGLRFDLSATMMISAFFLLLLNLPGKFKFSKYYLNTILVLYFIFTTLAILFTTGDIFYYNFAKRRISYEIFNLFQSIPELLKIILHEYVLQLIIVTFFILLLAYLWFKLSNKTPQNKNNNLINNWLYFVLTIIVTLISIRGGLQLKPLRESYAFRNDNIALGHLSLNPVFTIIRTLNRGNLKDYNFLEMGNSIKIVRKLLQDEDEIFLNDEYPLMRMQSFRECDQIRKNVVILIMESWPGNILQLYNSNITPNFYDLVKRGIYFSNFFATGQRTIQGMQAIVGSIPNVAYDDILGSPIEQHKLRPLGVILKEFGYKTIFIHGARSGSMGFEAFAKLSGFDTYISKKDFDLKNVQDDGTWGIFDHYVFERANQEFENIQKPFLGVVMSLSSHAPYTLPSKEFEYFDSTVTNYKLLNSFRYSDWSIGKFFSEAQKLEYYKNTIFIITSDHAEGTTEKNFFELFHIPCLIFAPNYLEPQLNNNIHSQVDIVPTIIDLLKLPTIHSSFGKSMLNRGDGFALLSTGNMFGWIRGKWFLISDFEKDIGLYDIEQDKNLYLNELFKNQKISQQMREEALSYIQTATYLLKHNKIFFAPF